MQKFFFLIFSLFLLVKNAEAQNKNLFRAKIVDAEKSTLIGAIVRWENTEIATTTDENGWMEIQRVDSINGYNLQISYVGYDDVLVEILPEEDSLQLKLTAPTTLEMVTVETKAENTAVSVVNNFNIETIGEGELKRAACCSLSESFETNGTVNVNATDAVSGVKEIEMLGLKGANIQMQVENRPVLNRLDRNFGLEYLAGSVIQHIQISKGASSARTGVQGLAGQINIELLKPQKASLFFINLYANQFGRTELNTNFNYRLPKGWAVGILVHTNYFQNEIDHNHDAFLDITKKKQWNVINRWVKQSKEWHIEFNLHALQDDRKGGQTVDIYHHLYNRHPAKLYQVNSQAQRYEFFGKIGYLGSPRPNESMSLIYNVLHYNQNMQIGDRKYNGLQQSAYVSGIYQNNLFNSKEHFINAGFQYNFDKLNENFENIALNRNEQLAAVYAEYEFDKKLQNGQSLGLIATANVSHFVLMNNVQKTYFSPRLNFKYNLSSASILRASAGRGVRMPLALAENVRYMVSGRNFVLNEYIMPEEGWNYGINYTHKFYILLKAASLNIDLYRTDFQNQLVADLDRENGQVFLTNLNGKSYSNSFLLTYSQDLFKNFNLRAAYKFNDVRTTLAGETQLQILQPQHRGLITAQYQNTKIGWQVDITAQFIGSQRLPHSSNYSKPYALMLAQVTKIFKNGWEVYLGGENLTNYTQQNPIINYQNPFSATFDASLVYAPVMGTMIYAGFRYSIPQKKGKNEVRSACNHEANESYSHKSIPADKHPEGAHLHSVEIKTSAQCGMCKTALEKRLSKMPEVEAVDLNLETQIFTITFQHGGDTDFYKKTISLLGYDADEIPANAKAYAKLPACCKKE